MQTSWPVARFCYDNSALKRVWAQGRARYGTGKAAFRYREGRVWVQVRAPLGKSKRALGHQGRVLAKIDARLTLRISDRFPNPLKVMIISSS